MIELIVSCYWEVSNGLTLPLSVRNEQAGLPRPALPAVGGGVEAASAEFRTAN